MFMSSNEVLSTVEKTQAMKGVLKRIDKITAAIISNNEQIQQWQELFPNKEIAENLLVAAALTLVRLRQVRQAFFFPLGEINHELLMEYENLSEDLAECLLAAKPMESKILFMPSPLDAYEAATDNNGGRVFSYLAKMTTLFSKAADPIKALAEALTMGATGYEQKADPEQFLRTAIEEKMKILLATAYSSGVLLTSLIKAFGTRSNLHLQQENILIRPFHFDDLVEGKIKDNKPKVVSLDRNEQIVNGIIRFDDASQRNERLHLEGSTMRQMAGYLTNKFPGIPIFNYDVRSDNV